MDSAGALRHRWRHSPDLARRKQFQAFGESLTHRKRSSRVSEVAEMAAFLASDRGSGMTGTVANLTGGLIVD